MNFSTKIRTSLIVPLLLLLSCCTTSLCWAGGYEAPKEGTIWGAALYNDQFPELKRMIKENPALMDASHLTG